MVSKERVNELVKGVLEKKEDSTKVQAYLDGAKKEIDTFMIENDLTEYECESGIIKISDSVRKGLDKEKVNEEVNKINDKEIDHIDMNTLYKQNEVHIISIKAKKATKEDK